MNEQAPSFNPHRVDNVARVASSWTSLTGKNRSRKEYKELIKLCGSSEFFGEMVASIRRWNFISNEREKPSRRTSLFATRKHYTAEKRLRRLSRYDRAWADAAQIAPAGSLGEYIGLWSIA